MLYHYAIIHVRLLLRCLWRCTSVNVNTVCRSSVSVIITVGNFIFHRRAAAEIRNTKLFNTCSTRAGELIAFSTFKCAGKYEKRRQKLPLQRRVKSIWIFFPVERRQMHNAAAAAAAVQSWLTAECKETSARWRRLCYWKISLLCCFALVVIWNNLLPRAQLHLPILRCMTVKVKRNTPTAPL